nr:MAG TPA: hypothetical protein [Caudoviricetes sp.]
MISCHFYCSSAEYPYHKYICIKQLKRKMKYKLKNKTLHFIFPPQRQSYLE